MLAWRGFGDSSASGFSLLIFSVPSLHPLFFSVSWRFRAAGTGQFCATFNHGIPEK
jgi:hypothetical protein